MFPSPDLTALSLLPVRWWRDVILELRSAREPGDVLERLLAGHPSYRVPAAVLRERARAALDRARTRAVQALAWDDPAYPALLAAIVDPPPVLWVRGSASVLSLTSVAIVGSRAGSPYALAVAERLAADLASRGIGVVSGLARGVDSSAHRAAVAAGGPTVAVLGCGADVVYPPEHAGLADEIRVSGAVVSELPPGTPPRAPFFPRRNRIISGLSRAVVIVEAGEKSGSLITARSALEQGRDVLAVPGSVLNGRNRGGHALLRDGAKIVESADDILEELQLPALAHTPLEPGVAGGDIADPVLAALGAGESWPVDVIAERTGLSPSRLLPRLLDLELHGVVRRVGGGRFMRSDRTC